MKQELVRRQEDMKKVDEIEHTLPLRIKELQNNYLEMKKEIEFFKNREEEKMRYLNLIDNY